METPETIRTSLQVGEWVTSIDFKDAYFHIPIHSWSRKYICFHIEGQSYQFKALPFGLSTAPMELTVVAKEVKLMALQKGIRIHQYLDDWLVRATSHQTCLQHTQTLVALCSELGWLVNKEKSELDPKQVLIFVGYQFDLREGNVRPTPEHWQTLTDKILSVRFGVPGPAVHVPHRTSNSHRGASPLRSTSYEIHTVALEEQLEGTGITRKGHTRPQVAPPSLKVVAGGKQCASRSTITPSKTCSADIYRHIKRRVGRSLKRTHCKGNLVPPRKQVAHKSLGTKGSLSGPKRVPRPLFKQHSPGSHRQHNSGCLYQQRRGDGVGLSVCPSVENPVQVYQETGNSQGTSHPRPTERDSRQAIQTWPDHSNRVVTSSSSVSSYMLPVAPVHQVDLFATRFNNKLPQFVSPVPDPQAWAVDALRLSWENLDPYAFPPAAILGKVVEKLQNYPCNRIILIAPGWPNIPGFAIWWQCLVRYLFVCPTYPIGSSTIQPDPTQEPVKPEPTCLAPRATAIKEQGFSEGSGSTY